MRISKIAIILILFCIISELYSQEKEVITGFKSGIRDTSKADFNISQSKKSEGLLEDAIDPEEYIVGPGDGFLISIISASSETVSATIAPDGRLLIKNVGVVDLDGKTLDKAYELIEKKIKSFYNSSEVYVILNDIRQFKVIVSGETYSQKSVKANSTDRVSEVIDKAGGLSKNASQRNIRLFRDDKIINVDLAKFYLNNYKQANPYVSGGDQIVVPSYSKNSTIEINGEIPNPTELEYNSNDSLSTIIRFAQGFLESSDLDSVAITRVEKNSDNIYTFYVDVSNWRGKLFNNSKLEGDIPLLPGDRVYVRKKKDWSTPEYIKILGEVNYPGKYSFSPGEDRISDILNRAGGFTDKAYVESTTLIRQKEFERKDQELERLKNTPQSEMSESEKRYFQARINERKGVMSIDFSNIINDPESADNILVEHKDSIIVPEIIDFINVQGRVNNPGNVKYNPNFNYLDYITLAGGFGYRSDQDATFITKSRGEQFLAEDYNYELEPGDTILVPPEDETTFVEIFTKALTVATQLVTIAGVVITIVRLN